MIHVTNQIKQVTPGCSGTGATPGVKRPATGIIILLCLALAAIILAVYAQVSHHPFIDFDDNIYVTENPHVVTGITGENIRWAFTSVESGNWHPLTWLSHMADVQLFGMNPAGHHLTSVAIHTISSLLLLLLLVRLTGAVWRPLFVAALFALHPLHVESVAWVAERKDVLSALFWFLTLHLYASYTVRRTASRYLPALAAFVMGLMAKPMLVTLPVILLLLDFWPLDRYQRQAADGWPARVIDLMREKIPFFVCSLFSACITIHAQHKAGAVSDLELIPVRLRLENALTSYANYIGTTFWPHDLGILYPFSRSIPLWHVIGSLGLLAVITTLVIRAGRRHPSLVVGWFWFLVTLLPVIGLIQVGAQSMADRYTYIPATGLFIMIAWGVPDLSGHWRYYRGMLALAVSAVIMASALVTWRQLGYWRDSISLFRHTLQITTRNYMIMYNLGRTLFLAGDTDAAIREYQKALLIRPDYTKARINLGLALVNKGELDAGILEYRAALGIKQDQPEAHNNLGSALARKGDLEGAFREFRTALRLNPGYAEAHYNLGLAYVISGDPDAAVQEYRTVLRINPHHADAQYNLGVLMAQKVRGG